jgi:hypothetical protein
VLLLLLLLLLLLVLQWVEKRIHNERPLVRAVLLGHLLKLIRDGHIDVMQLHQGQLEVLVVLGRNIIHARDANNERSLVLNLAASLLPRAAGSAGPASETSSRSAGRSDLQDWPGQPGSQQFVLTGCVADLVAEVMVSTSDWGELVVTTADVHDTQDWKADWGHLVAEDLLPEAAAAAASGVTAPTSQASTRWGCPAAVAGWMPPLPVALHDLAPVQREAWFFAVAEAAEAVLRYRQQQQQQQQLEAAGGEGAVQQEGEQPAATADMLTNVRGDAAAETRAALVFKRIVRRDLSSSSSSSSSMKLTPSPLVVQQPSPAGLPSWLPRLFWDAEYVEPLLTTHQDLLQLLTNVLLQQLEYIPGSSKPVDDDLLGRPDTAGWFSAAVDAAVGQLLKVLCLHVAQVQNSQGSILHQLLPHVGPLDKLILQSSSNKTSSSSSGGLLQRIIGDASASASKDGISTPHTSECLIQPLKQLLPAWLVTPVVAGDMQLLLLQLAALPGSSSSDLQQQQQQLIDTAEAAVHAVDERARQVLQWLDVKITLTPDAAAAASPSTAAAVVNLADGQAAVISMLLQAPKELVKSLLWLSPLLSAGLMRSVRSYSLATRLLLDQEAQLASEIRKLDMKLSELQHAETSSKQPGERKEEEEETGSVTTARVQATRRKKNVEQARHTVLEWLCSAMDLWVKQSGG